MTDDTAHPAKPVSEPVSSLDDPRVVQMLSSEHASLASARSLAYNEAFTRGDMFLAFLAMSFVALALLAQVLPINRDFLLLVTLVLAFDVVVGLTTYGRVIGANYEDYLAVYGMARVRHGYLDVAPIMAPYITTSIHDDLEGVMVSYGSPPTRGFSAILYGLMSSGGMIGLIVSMLGGVLALMVALILDLSLLVGFVIAAVVALVIFVALAAATILFYGRVQARLAVAFPTPTGRGTPVASTSRGRP